MPTIKYKTKDGKRVTGTTTIISGNLGWDTPMLMGWCRKQAMAGKDPNVIRDFAADTGTFAHYLVECSVKKEKPEIDKKYSPEQKAMAANAFKGYKAYEKKYKPNIIGCEISLVSEKYGYGGTIDLVSSLDDKIYINDLKTSNFVSPKMVIQIAAYRNLYEEVYGKKVAGGEIIQLIKEAPAYKLYQITEEQLDIGWNIFKQLLELHKAHKILELPMTDEGILINE